MITLQNILNTRSGILDRSNVKLIRHKDNRTEYRDVIRDKASLLDYQRIQPKDVFKECDYIVSFIGLERKRSVLFNVFKVKGSKTIGTEYSYDLEPVDVFKDFVDRLIIDWGNNTRAWHQWYHKQTKEVIELLPKGYIGNFPGLVDFVLRFDELEALMNNPEANHEWKQHLSSVNGIYLILDTLTGQQYVGSACGKGGIWQRWSDYTTNGTGGNKELINLHQNDIMYHRHFHFSVLQTLPSNMTKRDIIAVENLYKQKLGSRAHGLNQN